MSKNSYISALNELGQSIWYDNLSLDVLQSGELAGLVEQGVSGLTSNPTIFKAAIADTNHYDTKIQELAKEGLDSEAITEELMVADVGAAADLLRDTFDRTRGADGYASIEVSPDLADDTEGTKEAAIRLWKKLDRPNVMIKIPATQAGIPAIHDTLKAGINVNITLIFSLDVYKQVVTAYISALQNLDDPSQIGNIASVASFFVSRVDALVEKRLAANDSIDDSSAKPFIGTVGIANSKSAYAHFEDVFGGDTFQALEGQGARVQRPLWASTGVKNPTFSDLLYVESLAGKDTVNTLPPKTLQSLLENCTVKPHLHENKSEAMQVLQQLGEAGISLSEILSELQEKGVSSFQDSYRELISAVGEKQKQLVA